MSIESSAPAANTPATESPVAESTESTENETTAEGTPETIAAGAASASAVGKPIQKKTAPEAPKSTKRTIKLKVDGQDVDEEFDSADEEALIKHLQMSKVAQKRMNEKATYEKQVAAFFNLLQTNPEKAMRDIGMDPEDFAVKTLQRKIEDDQKSPEQRELEKTKRELEEYRAQIKAQEEERRNGELSRLQVEQERQIEDGMISALEQTKLPNEPLVVKKIAEIMLTALENKLDINPLQAAQIAKKELEADMAGYVSALPDEALEALLGKERLAGMRKKQVAAIKKAGETANSVKPTGNSITAAEEKKKPVKKMSMSNFLGGRN